MRTSWLFAALVVGGVGCGPALDGESDGTGSSNEDSSTTDPPPSTGEDSTTSTEPSPTTVGPVATTVTTFDSSSTTSPIPPDVGTSTIADGRYLLAVSTTLSPTTPFQFIANVENGAAGPWMSLQPLSLDITSTDSPREPVGELVTATGVEEGIETRFEFPNVTITGAANPITGADVEATVVLVANCGLCGPVEGAITVPLDYDLLGSSFSSVALGEGPLPPVPPMACVDCL